MTTCSASASTAVLGIARRDEIRCLTMKLFFAATNAVEMVAGDVETLAVSNKKFYCVTYLELIRKDKCM